jgi:hypothetical protein
MIKKRKWIFISVIAVVVVLAGIILGVAVYANSNSGTTTSSTQTDPQKLLADKVAAILGLDNATVEAAFTQAQTEIKTERQAANLKAVEARIDQMVTDGKLTADQAAQYKTWLESKPNFSIPGLNEKGGFGRRGCGPAGLGKGPFSNGTAGTITPPSTATTN